MATRTTSAGVSAAVQGEEIRLDCEWKKEDRANILQIRMPDFVKEQLKITCVDSTRKIRVTGERQISCTKSYKFSQTFPVPQNCDVHNIQAKFGNGTLTVIMPKCPITQDVAVTNVCGKVKKKNVAAAAKDAVKGLAMEMSEDRQTMATVGVAVLVIAAVGAYLYYRHKSPGNAQE